MKSIQLAIITILLFIASILGYTLYNNSVKLRDANNIIAARVDEIQNFDRKLGIANSNLRRQKDLSSKYKDELSQLDKDFTKMTKKYKLGIRSRDRTIAGLKGRIEGGDTTVTMNSSGEFTTIVEVTRETCNNQQITYKWQDNKDRFHLIDPDIFEKDDEIFEYKQHFEIKGFVFADKTGKVQVKKVELKEVYPVEVEGENLEYEEIEGSNITLVSSDFEYSTNNLSDSKSLSDILTLRPIASFDTAVMPGLGLEVVNLGKYFDYMNFGLYGKVALDGSDPLGGSLQNSRIGIGVNYHLIPKLLSTNFAIGASINTPFNDLGQYIFTVDFILYLTDDLNPFK